MITEESNPAEELETTPTPPEETPAAETAVEETPVEETVETEPLAEETSVEETVEDQVAEVAPAEVVFPVVEEKAVEFPSIDLSKATKESILAFYEQLKAILQASASSANFKKVDELTKEVKIMIDKLQIF